MIMRARPAPAARANAAQSGSRRDDVRTDVAERREPASSAMATKRPRPRRASILQVHALDGLIGAEPEDLLTRGSNTRALFSIGMNCIGAAVPIHLRAEPGDYAEACLLPGDPLRAKYIAETFFDDVACR